VADPALIIAPEPAQPPKSREAAASVLPKKRTPKAVAEEGNTNPSAAATILQSNPADGEELSTQPVAAVVPSVIKGSLRNLKQNLSRRKPAVDSEEGSGSGDCAVSLTTTDDDDGGDGGEMLLRDAPQQQPAASSKAAGRSYAPRKRPDLQQTSQSNAK